MMDGGKCPFGATECMCSGIAVSQAEAPFPMLTPLTSGGWMGGSPSGWLLFLLALASASAQQFPHLDLQTVHIDFIAVTGVMADVRYQRCRNGDRRVILI